jgi:hypothetical protein
MKIFETFKHNGLNYIMAKPGVAKYKISDMIQKKWDEEKLANRSKTIKTILKK